MIIRLFEEAGCETKDHRQLIRATEAQDCLAGWRIKIAIHRDKLSRGTTTFSPVKYHEKTFNLTSTLPLTRPTRRDLVSLRFVYLREFLDKRVDPRGKPIFPAKKYLPRKNTFGPLCLIEPPFVAPGRSGSEGELRARKGLPFIIFPSAVLPILLLLHAFFPSFLLRACYLSFAG